jgi:LacI family transcriptional regulator
MQGLTDDPAHPGLHIFSARDQWLVSAAQLAEFMVDGVLLVGVENDDYLRKFAAWGIPGVVVDYGSSGVPLDCVACDNEAGARRAVRYLLDLGHRRIAYVEWKAEKMAHLGSDGGLRIPMRSSDAIERREAVTRALGEAPDCRWQTLTFDISPDPSVPASVRELAAGWRKEKDHPTAFLTSDDSTANQLITALTEQGVDVPREVSVCAVAGAGVPLPGGLLVTQSRFDFSGMGRKALEILRQRCEHPSEAPAPDVHRVGFEWLEGSSTSSKTGVTQ